MVNFKKILFISLFRSGRLLVILEARTSPPMKMLDPKLAGAVEKTDV